MVDLAVVGRLPKIELVELVSLLAHRLGGLPDEIVDEARFFAATRRAEAANAAVSEAFADYLRVRDLHERAIAEGRRSTLDVAGAALAYGRAAERERDAFARLGALRMEIGR
jgi:hypothetical protein